MKVEITDINTNHLKELHKWELDAELQIKTGVDVPRTYEQFNKSYMAYFNGEKPNLLLKAIQLDGRLIGKVELYRTKKRDYIGIVIAQKRNHGVGTEALNLFLLYISEELGVDTIFAEVYEDNGGSLRFFAKNGFLATGERTEEWFRGKPRTLVTLKKELN
ncbi:Acetyltransferase (GNAT) domain-containing protein [Halobacillus dabanensis]|uniref:Acetyltransferase (GNAT) domain-containing protein n=1 Tax=Halobacillus dabanensis TaxID=240302 RepID=A0A1I3TUQ9_HALDA|nr:GNAT family N-acetyltransferase [Halobacillus dabanensis]SFJ74515.1 Acetyltransferase (GNAT) domain-containing protein [Halobacillus dabanensis]